MADTTDGQAAVTATTAAGTPPAAATGGEEGFVKQRIQRALAKREPEFLARGRAAALEELGIAEDDLETVKELIAKRQDLKAEEQRRKKQDEKSAARLAELERDLASERAVNHRRLVGDAIAGAVGDTRIVPGTMPQIARLLGDRIGVVEGKISVLDDAGEPTGKAVKSVVDAFFAAEGKHFLAATAPQGGAGSRPGGDASKPPKPLSVDEQRVAFDAFIAAAEAKG